MARSEHVQELIRWEEKYPEIFGYLFEKQPESPKRELVEAVEYDFGNMFEGVIGRECE